MKHTPSHPRAGVPGRRHCILHTSIAAVLLGFAANAPAASFTWSNGAANFIWDTTSLDWSGVAWPVVGTDNDAIFGATGVGALTIAAGGVAANDLLFSAAGYSIGGGALTLNGAVNNITTNADGAISAGIAGANGFTKLGSFQVTLNGSAANTFTGTTIVDNGTLVLGKTGGAVAINGAVQMGGGNGNQPNLRAIQDEQFGAGVVMTFVNAPGAYPRFDLQGTTQTLAGIQNTTGGGIIQNEKFGGGGTTAAATLKLNNTSDYSYNGYIRDRDGGAGTWLLNLVKNGVGKQTLAGPNITYTGTTIVNSGILELQDTSGFVSSTIVNSGATLRLNNTAAVVNATVTIVPGGTLNLQTANTTVDANRFAGTLAGTGTIVKDGPGWFHVQGNAPANFQGTIQVQQGRFGNAFNTTVWTNSKASISVASGAELDLRTDDIIVDKLTGAGSVVNTFFLGETNALTVGVNNGTSQFDGIITGTQTGANNTSTTAGRTALTKSGSGTFTLTNAGSDYVGPTTVNAGTLVLQSTRLVTGDKTVNAGGTLEINSEVPFLTRWNNPGTISGAGILNKTGSGVFGTTGAVNFSGTINILAGRLMNDNVSGNWTGSTASVNVSPGAVLDLRANDIYVDKLNGSGEVWNSHPAGGGDVLFVGVANGSSSFGGAIMGDGSQPPTIQTARCFR